VLADARRVPDDVEAGDARGALVRSEQGRQDSNGRRFAGAVGPEEAEDRPRLDAQVNPPKRMYVPVALSEPLRLDRESLRAHAPHATHPAPGAVIPAVGGVATRNAFEAAP
jgi:phytoene dehydrogenase-like protein